MKKYLVLITILIVLLITGCSEETNNDTKSREDLNFSYENYGNLKEITNIDELPIDIKDNLKYYVKQRGYKVIKVNEDDWVLLISFGIKKSGKYDIHCTEIRTDNLGVDKEDIVYTFEEYLKDSSGL